MGVFEAVGLLCLVAVFVDVEMSRLGAASREVYIDGSGGHHESP